MKALLTAALLWPLSALSQGNGLPDLAQLKLAAEAGDPVAQFNYGRRIAGSNYQEQFTWYLRSAQQGYAPAQNITGEHLEGLFPYGAKKGSPAEREAVQWISRAAFQGFPAAQLHLADYYDKGIGVPKDGATAYMWTQVVMANPHSSANERSMAGYARDRIIANTSSANVAEGQRRAAEFAYPKDNAPNPTETELMYAQLKLGSIFHLNNRASAMVNNVRFNSGETKDVKVGGQLVKLTCTAIADNSARFKIGGGAAEVTLVLKH